MLDRLREYLRIQMERTRLRHIKVPPERTKVPCIILRLQANPPSAVIEDEGAIPACYKRTETVIKLLRSEMHGS